MSRVAPDIEALQRIDRIRDALDGWRGQPWDFRAPCPLEPDEHRRLLHVWVRDDGERIAIHCFHGCTGRKPHGDPKPVMDALGLPMTLLFPANGDRRTEEGRDGVEALSPSPLSRVR